MNAARLVPRSLASRLYLILIVGLLAAHALSFGLLFYERYVTATSMMLGNLERDVSTAVALLDRLPANERAGWLDALERRTFRYRLDAGTRGDAPLSARAQRVTDVIAAALGTRYPIAANTTSTAPERFEVHLTLGDGAPLTIEVTPSTLPVAQWLPFVLAAQLALLLACTWLAVRLATRPLARLADAAASLEPGGSAARLPAGGPTEVARAATAFNALQDRIAEHLAERLEILAAISHDLQTPITRMQLRVEAIDALPERGRLLDDLDEMQRLVRDGVAYARSAHGTAEPALRVDLAAFLDSLVCDYQDIGKPVTLAATLAANATTRPQALRRVVTNLVDNALAYAGSAEVALEHAGDALTIAVRDRGPGIAVDSLATVMQPFRRGEASRSRATGGAGLGLAIAQQLTRALGGTLTLRNRDGGGLEALLRLPS
jgi:signal transduction histidine kinase